MRWMAPWILMIAVSAAGEERVDARQLFEKLRSLEGTWSGQSTKGWDGTLEIRSIARGSAVVSISLVDPHPGETMMTVYHLDGDRLMLTHYCVARNQPRLVATSWNPEQETATFSFLDGTNMRSRDDGHMDGVVMKFVDVNRFSSRWSFYRDGREDWLEEIVWERTSD